MGFFIILSGVAGMMGLLFMLIDWIMTNITLDILINKEIYYENKIIVFLFILGVILIYNFIIKKLLIKRFLILESRQNFL